MTNVPTSDRVNPWLSHAVRIAAITPESDGVSTYALEFVDPLYADSYQFRPGQFNMLYLPGVGESAISLSAHPASRERWAHTIRASGNVTQSLARLEIGATLGLRGPFGTGWPIEGCVGHDVILVGGGIGLAPLRPLIYHLIDHRPHFGRVTLIHGARTPTSLLYTREYEAWRRQGIDVQTTVDRASSDWSGHVGVATLLLDRLPIPRVDDTTLFVCGPELMMHFTAQSAFHRGMAAERLWLSAERNMQCAVGHCGHCQLGPTFVCREGPVFRYDRLAPFLRIEGL